MRGSQEETRGNRVGSQGRRLHVQVVAPEKEEALSSADSAASDKEEHEKTPESPEASDAEESGQEEAMKKETLWGQLKRMAIEANEDEEVVAEMKRQGKTRPTSVASFRNWAARQSEPILFLNVHDGSLELNPLHLMAVYATPAQKKDRYDGEFLTLVEKRKKGVCTVFVKAKDHFFQWKEATLPKLQDDRSDAMSE